MSTRAKAAAALASLGVIVVGWQVATAHGQTVTAGSASTSPDPTSAPATSTPDSTSADSTPTAAPSAGSSASATPSTSSGATGTFTGTTATHRYGSVTVTVTMVNGKITNLTEKIVSDGDHHSEGINSSAVPVIRKEVLAANSASVSTVSGATYTTQAYLTSLQSALDKA